MKTLVKNGKVVNVFTAEIENVNILICDKKIIGVGSYSDEDADKVIDASGKFICPSFIDGHIHIESSMLLPSEFAKVCVPHGTCAVIADPHEIANVLGTTGISFMMDESKNLPMYFYFVLPSCVPATPYEDNGAVLLAKDLKPFYADNHVLGLGEVMNMPGVINGDPTLMAKIEDAAANKKNINGHAPFLRGRDLDKYIAAGVQDDHECTMYDEAIEKLRKGMWIMIREGTSSKNLSALIDLFDNNGKNRCMLVTDDKHSYDLLHNGHIDAIIRKAVSLGKNVVTGIQMATIQAAQCFSLKNIGAIAPGYFANFLILDDLEKVDICDVYFEGKLVYQNKQLLECRTDSTNHALIMKQYSQKVRNTFHIKTLEPKDFAINKTSKDVDGNADATNKTGNARVIKIVEGTLITEEEILPVDLTNSIDVERDILKIAVCERHKMTGHIGVGFVKGFMLKKGAIASSVAHDSHNLVIIGTNENDMALAGNTIAEMGGGICVTDAGKVLAKIALPIAGLMSDKAAEYVAAENEQVRLAVEKLGVNKNIEPFMLMAFLSLSVIPALKITTKGLMDVKTQQLVPVYV